jgi:hypothetical protein
MSFNEFLIWRTVHLGHGVGMAVMVIVGFWVVTWYVLVDCRLQHHTA